MNPNRLDLNLLRVFGAILDTRSVTAAAESESAVSPRRAKAKISKPSKSKDWRLKRFCFMGQATG